MRVVTRGEMQEIDRYTIEQIGLDGTVLMENAGRAVYEAVAPELDEKTKVLTVIGKGNNGGDGFVVARYLLDSPADSQTWLLTDPDRITGDAARHMRAFLASGGIVHRAAEEPDVFSSQLGQADVIVDAMLGTGIHGTPYPEYVKAIGQINRSNAEVIAVDLPSGVPADGEPFTHEAVRADRTMTLGCPKLAQFTEPAARYFGDVRVLSIGIPAAAFSRRQLRRSVIDKSKVVRTLPERDPFAHKGSSGKGLIVAGSEQMSGAAFFAAKAALRSGIGLLKLCVPESARQAVAAQLPETMFMPRAQLDFEGTSGIAVGPGLGRDPDQAGLVRRAIEYDAVPCVVDADGLYHLTGMLGLLKQRRRPIVLTPHPGEMARMTGLSVQDIENNRFRVAEAFAKEYGVYLILKGRYTIVTAPDGSQAVNMTGNPALAKGGSGDVLTGIVLAFLLQHDKAMDALCNAVYIHGAAADALVADGHSMLDVLASDLIDCLPLVLHRLYDLKTR